MDSSAKVDRQRVYLAYRELFSGNNAFVRDKRVIRSMIKASGAAVPIANRYLKRKTIPILKSLLNDRVFELEEEARKEFPQLWEKSQDRTCCQTSTKGSAVLREPARHNKEGTIDCTEVLPHSLGHGAGCDAANNNENASPDLVIYAPRLSRQTQHYFMSTVQRILEASCFHFMKKWLPSVLEERGWNCAAALELTCWIQLMRKDMNNLPEACIDEAGRTIFRQIWRSLARIRHTAVHRIQLESDIFLEHIHSAHMLAEILQDKDSASSLRMAYDGLKDITSKANHNIEAISMEVNEACLDIQKQREALTRHKKQLQKSAKDRASRVAEVVDESVLRCLNTLTDVRRLEISGKGISQKINSATYDGDFLIDEDYIESDEDRLQADLK